jgi:hypothetical protein
MAYINTDIPIFSAYLDTSFLYNKDPRSTNEFIMGEEELYFYQFEPNKDKS